MKTEKIVIEVLAELERAEAIQAIAMGFRFLKNLREAEFATDKQLLSEMETNIINAKIIENENTK